MDKRSLTENYESIKKEYLESEMTLDELAIKWATNRYALQRLFKANSIKRPYRKNLIGKRIGKLVVIQFLGSREGNGLWKCKCDCGNEKEYISKLLNYGAVRSCGCLQKEKASQHIKTLAKQLKPETLINWVIAGYRHRAKEKGSVFGLSLEECSKLFSQNCHYCKASPSSFKTNKTNTSQFYYNGIDRIDNSRGYEKDNVVSCCGQCNRAKGVLSQKDFYDWIQRVKNFQFPS